jgi:hypothetical protein
MWEKTMKRLKVGLAWTRMPTEYIARVGRREYKVRKGKAFPWVAFRDGATIGNAPTLAEAKELAVKAAIEDAIYD